MSRQIVLDTETTGLPVGKGVMAKKETMVPVDAEKARTLEERIQCDLDSTGGHRIVEIAAVELIGRQPTGAVYHTYLNPGRAVDPGAQRIHGLSNTFLESKPVFSAVVEELLAFLQDSELIMHNAKFDTRFINYELALLGRPSIDQQCLITDSLAIARKKHPGSKNSLDALCRRYGISLAGRKFHGALLDAELLSQVYLFLTAEGQGSLLTSATSERRREFELGKALPKTQQRRIRVILAQAEELQVHQQFVKKYLARERD